MKRTVAVFQRQILTFFTVLVFVSALIMGCVASQESKRASASGTIELTIWTLQLSDFKDYLNDVFRRFENEHPGVHVTWVDIPFSEGEKKALTAILSHQAPDVMNLNPDFSAVLSARGTLVNMNTVLTRPERESYLPVAWQACSLQSRKAPKEFGVAYERPVAFGVPWYITSAVTYANRDVLRSVGLRRPPRTSAELYRLARQLKLKTGNSAMFPTLAENGRFLKMLFQAGIPLQDAEGRYVFADKGAGKELAVWVMFFKEGLIPKESLTQGHQDAMDRFQSGSLAMLVAGTPALGAIQKNAPTVFKRTLVTRQFPAGSPNVDFSVMTLVVPKSSPHPKEAVALATFLTNEVNSAKLSELAPVLPSNRRALKRLESRSQANDALSLATHMSAEQLLSSKQAFQIHPRQKQVNQIIDFYVQSALLGKMTPDDAMREAQDQINALIAPTLSRSKI